MEKVMETSNKILKAQKSMNLVILVGPEIIMQL